MIVFDLAVETRTLPGLGCMPGLCLCRVYPQPRHKGGARERLFGEPESDTVRLPEQTVSCGVVVEPRIVTRATQVRFRETSGGFFHTLKTEC